MAFLERNLLLSAFRGQRVLIAIVADNTWRDHYLRLSQIIVRNMSRLAFLNCNRGRRRLARSLIKACSFYTLSPWLFHICFMLTLIVTIFYMGFVTLLWLSDFLRSDLGSSCEGQIWGFYCTSGQQTAWLGSTRFVCLQSGKERWPYSCMGFGIIHILFLFCILTQNCCLGLSLTPRPSC